MSGLGHTRLAVKLALVLFITVAGALAIVYLAVLPQLESRLVDAKIRELDRAAPNVAAAVADANRFRLSEIVTFFSANLNARVVVYERLTERSLRPIADSSGLRSADVIRDEVALEAATTGLPASDRVRRGDRELAETAVPASTERIVLLSAPLSDALANVRLVRRSILIAGSIALAVSWLAGVLAAWSITRRISRLEDAAERIAGGDFQAPVVDRGRDEIAQLAAAFETMRQRLSQLDRARREFIANASHELRTPLFSLGGFLELLDDEELDERTKTDFIAEMRAQVERLTRLATDLLDLTRLDAGQLSVATAQFDLADAARTVTEEFRAVADSDGRELRLAADDALQAVGDEQRVIQIGRILVENAVRHTPAGTEVTVEAKPWEARALLIVRDEGPGISAPEQERVFDRFYRGEGVMASGSGLGLAIAQELAQKMGATLTVRSRPGETVFTLSLPLGGRVVESGREAGVSTQVT